MRDLLDRSWFVEAPPARLALLRILIGSYSLYYVGSRVGLLDRVAHTDPSLFQPVGIMSPLTSPLAPGLFHVIVLLTLAAGVLFVLGWRHRTSGPIFGLLLRELANHSCHCLRRLAANSRRFM